MNRPKSLEIFERMKKIIPGGVNSPIRSFSQLDTHPLIASSGKGPYLYDVDGNRYLDYCMSWGSLILGHCPFPVTEEVKKQVDLGSSFGLSTHLEEKMAQQVLHFLPWVDKLRFVSSGTEATMSALRLARGVTGRNKIIKFMGNYHGHVDHLLVKAGSYLNFIQNKPSTMGIPQEMIEHTISLPYNDEEALQNFMDTFPNKEDIAGCILEPVAGNMGVVPASLSFIQKLREFTHEIGAALIFDEVITGFRVARGGAVEVFGIEPDLICLGKIFGGGYPAAAFGGKEAFMRHLAPLGSIFQAGTLSGNPVAMAAGIATLQELSSKDFYEELTKKMDFLCIPIENMICRYKLPAILQRKGSMFTLFLGKENAKTNRDTESLDPALFQEFFFYLLERGIYISPSCFEASFISSAHTEENLRYTTEIIKEFLYNKFIKQ